MKKDKNYEFFKKNLDGLIKNHYRKYVIIHDEKFISYHETFQEAANAALKDYEEGTFLVQECVSMKESTLVFSSRVGV